MNDDDRPWLKLCQRASVEQDSEKLWDLVKEIIRLLEEDESKERGISRHLEC